LVEVKNKTKEKHLQLINALFCLKQEASGSKKSHKTETSFAYKQQSKQLPSTMCSKKNM